MEEIREGRRAPVKGGARTIESREERKASSFRVAAPTSMSGSSSPPSLLVVPLEVVAVDPCPCHCRELVTGIGAEGEGRVRRGSYCCRRRELEELPSAAAVVPVAAVCRHYCVCHHRHLWSVTVEQIREERENLGRGRCRRRNQSRRHAWPPENLAAAAEKFCHYCCRRSGRRRHSRWLLGLPANRLSYRRCFVFLVWLGPDDCVSHKCCCDCCAVPFISELVSELIYVALRLFLLLRKISRAGMLVVGFEPRRKAFL
ncbi:uncharacterized protein DS421_10g300570 [Arachis hypogaea]|nr:uncharacterized protein DS421_10g300570 [Arachis hypogaea]